MAANKIETGKPRYEYLPWDALEDVVRVFEYGAGEAKYNGPFTYRKGILFSKLFGAMIRHAIGWFYFIDDEDDESGCHPLAHVAANALMLLTIIKNNKRPTVWDDRPRNTGDGFYQSLSPMAFNLDETK